MEFLVTYDISTTDIAGQRRLARTAKVCEGYGLRVQKSVFECRLTSTAFQQLANDALDVIDPRRDSFNIYRFDGRLADARISLGRGLTLANDQPWIV